MPTFRQHINHRIAGGWATDFGPTAAVVPDQNGVVLVPFLADAEDMIFQLNGAARKVWGTTRLNSSALESGAAIKGLFDYWRQGTGGSPTQRRVVHVGAKIYADSADGTFSEIASGLVADAVPNYATFDDLLIIASDAAADVPRSWDGTTFQNLAGSPPNFAFSAKHKNYLFAAGVDANPSTLYYSATVDPEDWTSASSGSISIDPQDGDRITGLASHKNELWVFKGPNRGSIHRITGSSESDWARTTFVEGVGAIWQNTIFKFKDDLGFMWIDGSVRSIAATDAFGDFREAALSFPIQSWLLGNLNFNRLRHAWAATDGSGARVFFTVPAVGSNTNNRVLVMDARFEPVRWSLLVTFPYASIALVRDAQAAATGRPTLMLGSYDGFVERWEQPTRIRPGTTSIDMLLRFPYLNYGAPHVMKTLAAAGLDIQPYNSGNVTFRWTRDGNTRQSDTISQGGFDPLGGATGFTLDTSQLGGSRLVSRWIELPTGGSFRGVQFEMLNSGDNEDVEIHGLSAFVDGGATSTDNAASYG